MVHTNTFFKNLEASLIKHKNPHNAHAHIDRFDTNVISGADTMTLQEKQSMTGRLHRELYTRESLQKRIGTFLKESAKLGIRRVDSFIDVALDIVLDEGLGALNIALDMKEKFKDQIEFNVGAYPIFGFKDSEPKRWELFVKAAEKADFLGLLPERDDHRTYKNGIDHIGFENHFKRVLKLAVEMKKQAHFHVDQKNHPEEFGTETLIEAVRWSDYTDEIVKRGKSEPFVWAVHAISPSGYSPERFDSLVNGLTEYNIGVICCPSAALSMKQLSYISAPIHNSIANILPMMAQGVPIRLGTDNVDDMFLPNTTMDLRDEINILVHSIRFYDTSILGKISCGKKLDQEDVGKIRAHIKNLF